MTVNNVDLQDKNGNSYQVMANPDSKAEFNQAGERSNIKSGESHRSIFGKISKYLADLKTVAFSGSYLDLTDKPELPAGEAGSYQVARNDTTNSDEYLVTAKVAYEHGQEIDKLNNDLTRRLPGGIGLQWDGVNFWGTTASGVKKNWVTQNILILPIILA